MAQKGLKKWDDTPHPHPLWKKLRKDDIFRKKYFKRKSPKGRLQDKIEKAWRDASVIRNHSSDVLKHVHLWTYGYADDEEKEMMPY